ncbi:MAG: DUF1349 domain-containing protein [Lachnospiraceae bacterium]
MNFQWLNESNLTKEGEKITIYAPAGTDFFCNDGTVSEEGVTPESLHNAPFYYTELSGDFVLTVKVSHDFKDTYDSSSLMVMEDLKNWAKSCFEKTDFGTHAAVSVVTKTAAPMMPMDATSPAIPHGFESAESTILSLSYTLKMVHIST